MKHPCNNEARKKQLQELKKIQRVFQITPSSDDMEDLIGGDMHSAYEIVNSSIDTHAGSVTLSPKQLAWIAYFIWKNESEPYGRGILHWLEAEKRLSCHLPKS